MTRIPLVIHERLGHWARQIRPRVATWPVRVIETRSASDLAAALARSACPLVVLDLADRIRAALDELDRALPAAPNALVLVLDPGAHATVGPLARELGATHVLAGRVPPPEVLHLLARWLPLARRRAEADGWAGEPEPEPWDLLVSPLT
ncbi:MAG: hypothetical protein IRY99_17685 [Isosphaeraceae bacterium]|nr:hypothetical protein [Isosphaeraceae bacterium]